MRPALLKNERGDTLVEVVFGLLILTAVLISSFTTANAAFRLGNAARTRSVAVNLLQAQAEALRNYRDANVANWTNGSGTGFYDVLKLKTAGFYMRRNASNKWVASNGSVTYAPVTVTIIPVVDSAEDRKLVFNLTATWNAPGANNQQTTISSTLVDLSDIKPCDASVAGSCSLATTPPPTTPLPFDVTLTLDKSGPVPRNSAVVVNWAATSAISCVKQDGFTDAYGNAWVGSAGTSSGSQTFYLTDNDPKTYKFSMTCSGSGSQAKKVSVQIASNVSCELYSGRTDISDTLLPGQYLYSCNSSAARAFLVYQGDGNLVDYDYTIQASPRALWGSGTDGTTPNRLVMQSDGNLVLYAKDSSQPTGERAVWASGTNGNPGAHAVLQDGDCNFVVYNTSGSAIWSSWGSGGGLCR